MLLFLFFFFFNDTATTEIYTLSLHDALPISVSALPVAAYWVAIEMFCANTILGSTASQRCRASSRESCSRRTSDRKSTRLNSSHGYISYAVFCLKKKTNKLQTRDRHRATGVD